MGASVTFTRLFTLARKSEISFHMKCEVKVKVKPIRCFHVKSRTLGERLSAVTDRAASRSAPTTSRGGVRHSANGSFGFGGGPVHTRESRDEPSILARIFFVNKKKKKLRSKCSKCFGRMARPAAVSSRCRPPCPAVAAQSPRAAQSWRHPSTPRRTRPPSPRKRGRAAPPRLALAARCSGWPPKPTRASVTPPRESS